MHTQAQRLESDGEQATRGPTVRLLVSGALAALLLAMTGLGVAKLLDPRTLPIMEVRVEGEFRRLKPAYLRERVARELHGGFFTLDVTAIRSALLAEPWVREVSVRRVWPEGVQVTVHEQRAVAYWGEDALLNPNGQIFRPDQQTLPEGLVHLRGPSGTHTEVLHRYLELEVLLGGHTLGVRRLTLSRRRAWTFELMDGPRIIVGRRDVADRLQRFRYLLEQGLRARLADIETVDLRYTNGIAVRFAQASHA